MRKILKYAAIALVLLLIAAGIVLYVMSRPDVARFSTAALSGRVPVMASQRNEIFPTMNLPEATRWPANPTPPAAQGLTTTRFARGVPHPRSHLALTTGDGVVARTENPPAYTSHSGGQGKKQKGERADA